MDEIQDNLIGESIDRIILLGEPAPGVCPKCKSAMELGQLDKDMVLICKECRGILIQSEIFGRAVSRRRKEFSGQEQTPPPMDAKRLQRHLNCPGCKAQMDVHPYHGPGNVIIDSCSKCWFMFLDEGELSSIETAPGRR